jgi:hypothetical protein
VTTDLPGSGVSQWGIASRSAGLSASQWACRPRRGLVRPRGRALPGSSRPSSARRPAFCPWRPAVRLRLAHHLASIATGWRGPDRAEAVGSRGLYAAGPALALPAERAAMRVRGPRLEIELRVIRWVAEEVVDERHPGAQAGLGRLEHMFETLGGGSDGMGARLQGKTGALHNAGEGADGALHNAAGRVDLGWPWMRIRPWPRMRIGPREDAHRPWPRTRIRPSRDADRPSEGGRNADG